MSLSRVDQVLIKPRRGDRPRSCGLFSDWAGIRFSLEGSPVGRELYACARVCLVRYVPFFYPCLTPSALSGWLRVLETHGLSYFFSLAACVVC